MRIAELNGEVSKLLLECQAAKLKADEDRSTHASKMAEANAVRAQLCTCRVRMLTDVMRVSCMQTWEREKDTLAKEKAQLELSAATLSANLEAVWIVACNYVSSCVT